MQDVRIVQFSLPGKGRRVGLVRSESVLDLTEKYPDITTTHQLFFQARSEANSLLRFSRSLPSRTTVEKSPRLSVATSMTRMALRAAWVLPLAMSGPIM